MSTFRKPKPTLREDQGAYVAGTYVPGARTVVTVLASAQPVVSGQDMQVLAEGRHLSDYTKFYSDTLLRVTADGEATQPDIIVHEGYGYELVSIYKNQSSVISHYKYIGVKVFKFTTDADWISGTLKRP